MNCLLAKPCHRLPLAGLLPLDSSDRGRFLAATAKTTSIFLLFGNNPAHTSPGLRNIARAPRYEVNVCMKNGLTRISACIDPDIEPRDCKVRGEDFPALQIEHGMDSVQLGLIEVEVISHMALWDDQCVQRGHRKSVTDHIAERIFSNDPLLTDCTENAGAVPVAVG